MKATSKRRGGKGGKEGEWTDGRGRR